MVFFANLGVNLRGCLCGVLQYASAQPLDFLDLDKKSSFLKWKLASARKAFLDGHELIWAEAINLRGKSLIKTRDKLRECGLEKDSTERLLQMNR
ncbi:MAG: hypothetical protein R6V25_09060, partial [Desulfatiglandales bacterium]